MIKVGSDPLELLRSTSEKRDFCGADGKRRPGVHWIFGMSTTGGDDVAPNLRTVGLQRITEHGIDYVTRTHSSSTSSISELPSSILYTVGKYSPGESIEQWRGEGYSEPLDLGELLDCIPHYTIVEMIASRRGRLELKEKDQEEHDERTIIDRRTHFMELVQKTRIELENGDITHDEMSQSIAAYRYIPNRMERMIGGPDHIMWDRWEWNRENGGEWLEPRHLLPY
eukprot:CAMPEP_0185729602 /NCGR_PEP_ID=MMETSP1171-20130828/6524_1 /TAXON_ID=374046 /ORGANISM="Helicotheca tamensis, Strain CCMP826" /LENGTH=225 /DNA_ID=CAMNT_0028398481 /DNA_START=233 /DNA_END=910 /DNA_ORIENTATION=-